MYTGSKGGSYPKKYTPVSNFMDSSYNNLSLHAHCNFSGEVWDFDTSYINETPYKRTPVQMPHLECWNLAGLPFMRLYYSDIYRWPKGDLNIQVQNGNARSVTEVH